MSKSKLNVLTAFPYTKEPMIACLKKHGGKIRHLYDSGAFTAWKLGGEIDFDEYLLSIDALPRKPWRYFTLDVVGDEVRTMQNYERMKLAGLQPMPILTRGAPFELLDTFFKDVNMVGLGGVAGANASTYAWVQKAMQHAAGRKVHILGFTSLDWIKRLRPYSVDSSSWLSAARYGNVSVYLGNGRMTVIRPRRKAEMPPAVAASIRRYGLDPYEVFKPYAGSGNNSVWQTIATASWVHYSLDQYRVLNSHLFLALTTPHWLDHLVDVYDCVERMLATPRGEPVETGMSELIRRK